MKERGEVGQEEPTSAKARVNNGAVGQNGDFQVEPMEVLPFEMIAGEVPLKQYGSCNGQVFAP